MDFALNDQQEMLKKSARDFLKSECPRSLVRELEESEAGYSDELWKKMARLGWMGILVPEEYGGAGWTLTEQAVLFEEFGRAAVPGPMFATLMGTLVLLEGAAKGLNSGLLPRVVKGDLILTLAMDEPEAVSDPRFVSTRAVGRDGAYKLSGTKLFVSYAHVAGCLLVVGRTAGAPGDEKGIAVFAVEGSTAGINLAAMKTFAHDKQFQVDLKGVSVPSNGEVAGPGRGLSVMRAALEKATAVQCAWMLGGAQQELEMTAEYTKNRIQFGRPVGTFQAVQHRLADMFIDVQAARWTTYQAVWRLAEAMPAARELAIAKAVTGKACQRVAFSAQQLHGGVGVDLDNDLHFYYLREKALELTLGTPAD
ncbi:MAG: acyl-CoA/acyl-ACP dehydrogenase, partial [Chloroflexi bacterium]|nr:acyl-CoA/acyl-ACP dehydrogenase [Chloroflexota bacterium]